MKVAETVLVVTDNEQTSILSYVARVDQSWFAISMLEEHLYCFEVHEQPFIDYAMENGTVILFDELPEDIYKCFVASFFVIAEVIEEIDENN